MRFAYIESMCDPVFYTALAPAAEECGFETFLVPDSICYPERSDSKYPYTPDGAREFLEDKPFVDPFVQVAAMAAVTKTIRFMTFVLKTPIRHPVLLAKQISSVAVMSQDRFDFGAGSSPWPDDFEVTGVPWEGRGARFDETLELVRRLLDGGYVHHQGKCFDIPSIKICPVPAQPVPVWIGGHQPPALHRAARIGNGWAHAGAGGEDDLDALKRMIAELERLRAEYGRSSPFGVLALSAHAFAPDGVRMLEDLGVTDVGIGLRDPYQLGPNTESLQRKLDTMRQFADQVIRR